MLDSAIAGNRFLVCSGVEKSYVERVPAVPYYRKEDCIGMSLGIVVVLAVACQTAEEHPVILIVPLVDREEDESLVQTPCVRKRGHERIVDHVPALTVILLLDIQDLENCRTGLAYSEIAELRLDVRNRNTMGFAHGLDLVHDFLDHVFVIIIPCQ